jgi:TrmH RNA methyltransferase
MTRKEICLCGLTAVRARFARDAGSIHRLFFDHETGRKLGVMSKALAATRKVYRCVEPAELEKISGTVHHGGVVAVVAAPSWRAPAKAEVARWAADRAPVLLLDRIGNAHNLGAIARTAAFFGVQHLILPEHPGAAVPNEAAYRVAEGGLEQLTVWRVPDLVAFIRMLTMTGYEVVGAATRGGAATRPAAAGRPAPVALALGNEEHGLAPELAAACTRLSTIPGSGRVESLNVAAAAAVLLHQLLAEAKRASSAHDQPSRHRPRA